MVNYSKAKRTIETMYDGKCTVYTRGKREDPKTGETAFYEIASIKNKPCRLSYVTVPTTGIVDGAPLLSQEAKLFIAPDVAIPPGSKLKVTQHGATTFYSQSGEPARYATHQEITLELFEGWA